MKKLSTCLLCVILGFFFFSACSDDDDDEPNCEGLDCLPTATQTGAGTFGCLVNGEPYVDNSGRFNCFIQNLDGIDYFNISPNFEGKVFTELDLGVTSSNLQNDLTVELSSCGFTMPCGDATFSITGEFRDVSTNSTYTGMLSILKLDFQENIISGKFSFRVYDPVSEDIYEVTDGRFDSTFTQ